MSDGSYHPACPARKRIQVARAVGICVAVLAALATTGASETASAEQVLSEKNVQRYRQAQRYLTDADQPVAAAQLAEQLTNFSVADDRRAALLVQTRMRTGHPVGAIEAARQWARQAPRAVDQIDAALTRGELHLLLADPESALAAAVDARSELGGLSGRPADVRYFNARWLRLRHDAHRGLGHLEIARQLALRLEVRFPAAEPTKQTGLVDHRDLTDAESFRRAKHLYDAWEYQAAREVFRELLERAPSEHIAEESRWHLAHIALNTLRDAPTRAESLFSKLSQPEGAHAEEALYQLARAHMRQEDYGEALDVLDTYRQRYPDGSHTEDVFYYRGWLPYDHRHNDRAITGFQNYIDRYGLWGPRSSYIHGFLAWTHMRQADWDAAIETYAKMEPYGNMLVWGKALYWMAYARWKQQNQQQALSRLDELRDTYPVTYYGVLGEQLRLRIQGNTPDAGDVWWPEDGGQAQSVERPSIDDLDLSGLSESNANRWRRTRALVELHERERARHTLDPMYDDLIDAVPGDRVDEATYAIGAYVGDFNRMWRRATRGSISAMAEPPTSDSLKAVMAYPRAYRSVVTGVASEFNLSEHLMYAIMRQESRYAPGQVSHTNAVGALQMIPATARKVAADLGVRYRPREFHRPEVGFRFSGFYMRKLLDLFEGKLVPMAAAYNSGPAAVVEWFDENPEAGFPWLIEEFAYNEGRNYCRKVAEHFVRYLYLYNDDEERRQRLLRQLFPQSREVTFPDDIGY
jgi:outer membrane protein assembly factor BamD (BamD/ComL family)